TIDLGRPLHVFDADKVRGGVLRFRPGAGETFLALNGREYTAGPEDCVIADAAGVQSLAGVIGGEATGCTEATTSVFIECALFDPVRVALTGRRHGITSDARQRFERGIDPAIMPKALEAATRMIQELCGGEASEVVTAGAEPQWQRSATLRFSALERLGGVDVRQDEAVDTLERLGFTIERRTAEAVTVAVPSWRNDVAAPIQLDQAPTLDPARAQKAAEGCAVVEPEADLVEEVLRIRGLDTIPPVSLPRAAPVPPATLTPRQVRAALAKRSLAAAGLLEAVTFSFMAGPQAALFGGGDPALTVVNPIASDLDQMRPTPVATLALAAARNTARGWPDSLLFEVGPAFASEGGVGTQEVVASGLFAGHTKRHPLAPSRPYGVMDAKAAAMDVLEALGVPMDSLSVTADAPGWYHPGRSGVVRQGPKLVLATFGELHPSVLAALDLPGPAAALEVFLDRIPEPKRRKRAAPDLPPFQPVRRDFAFLVPADVPVDSVLRAAKGAERNLIAEVSLFDLYEGDKVPAGQKSVGIEVVLQPRERTLTDAEIEAAAAKVVAAVAKKTGGTLR
ncbi:MAG TPA: phenylalanine--tRNA ligase subunit beta, partial [Acetobacteraceae bacterium]|nr:phenylalanine--tRNA ligase subunit beta [Acetobacteraceae bacterium]